jgi:hypothetical protein
MSVVKWNDTFGFDVSNKLVLIYDPVATVSCQDIYNAIADFRAEPFAMGNDTIAIKGSGKQTIDPGPPITKAFLLIDMQDGWKLKFEDRAGPTFTRCQVSGGVVIGGGGSYYPVEESDYTHVQIFQAVSGTLIVTSAGVGTPAEVGDAVWGADTSGPSAGGEWAAGTFGRIVRAVLTLPKFIGLK